MRFLTRFIEIEVAGLRVNLDVLAEIHAQIGLLRNHNITPNIVELSPDAYDVAYLQTRERHDVMGLPMSSSLQEIEGCRVRRVPGTSVVRALHEYERPHPTEA